MNRKRWFASLGARRPAELVSRENEGRGVRGTDAPRGGPTVDVVDFPPLPNHNRVEDSRYTVLLACSYAPLVVAGWAGFVLGRRLLRAV